MKGRVESRYVATAAIALVFYCYCWLAQPERPEVGAVFDDPAPMVTVGPAGVTATEVETATYERQATRYGWFGKWYDQFHYARMARTLGHFRLPGRHWDARHMRADADAPTGEEASSFSYGLGYPVVGAVFYGLGFKGDPFVVPDAILFVLAAMLALALADRVLRPATALVVVNVFMLTAPFVVFFVVPWSNTLTTVAVLGALLVVTGRRFDWPVGIGLAAAISLVFAARYTDVVWLVALVAIPLVPRSREAWRVLVSVAVGLVLTATLVAVAQNAVFGSPFRTPYHYVHNGLDASWDAYRIGNLPGAAWGVLVAGDRTELFGNPPLLRQFPWAVLAVPGVVLLWRRRDRFRVPLTIGALVGATASISYLAWAFGGTDALRYWAMRFHLPFLPLWAVLAGVSVEWGVDRLAQVHTHV